MKKTILTTILALSFAVLSAGCNSVQENGSDKGANSSSSLNILAEPSAESGSPTVPGKTISDSDIKTVKSNYDSEDRPVYDACILDLDFDGEDELLVLTSQVNPKVLEVWEKNSGKMERVSSFGAGKVNYIDKISFKEGEVDGEKAYLFTFAYDEGGSMKADEVLSAVKKTSDGYEVEHLLSRGTITYSDIREPFAKVFYRKGWNKGDIGMDQDYGDISKEEYNRSYEKYMG